MSPGDIAGIALEELLGETEDIVRQVADRIVASAWRVVFPATFVIEVVDIIQQASGKVFNLPATVLAKTATRWALAVTPNVSESRVITELAVCNLVVDFAVDAMWTANGLLPRTQRGLQLAVLTESFARVRQFRDKVLDRLTAIEGGAALRLVKLLGKPLRLALWGTQILTAIARWVITVFLLILLLAWVEFCKRGGLRDHTLRQDSKRVLINLPPTRLRRRIP